MRKERKKMKSLLASIRQRGVLFVVIGGGSVVMRLFLLWIFVVLTMPTGIANFASLISAITINFALHYRYTWNDRLPVGNHTTSNTVILTFALWITFILCSSATIALKSILIPLLSPTITNIAAGLMGENIALQVGVVMSGIIGEVIGFPINFLTADKISFGAMVRVANRFHLSKLEA